MNQYNSTTQQNHADTDHAVESTSTACNPSIDHHPPVHSTGSPSANQFLNALRRQVKKSLKACPYDTPVYKTLIAELHTLITVLYVHRLDPSARLKSLKRQMDQLAKAQGIYRVLAEHIMAQLPAQAAPQSVMSKASSPWTALNLSGVTCLKNLPKTHVFRHRYPIFVDRAKCLPAEDLHESSRALEAACEALPHRTSDTAELDLSGVTALKNLPQR